MKRLGMLLGAKSGAFSCMHNTPRRDMGVRDRERGDAQGRQIADIPCAKGEDMYKLVPLWFFC